MKFEEYLAEQGQDAEYREAENRLRPYLDLANKVLALRLERGWSQAELGRRVGTRQANISRIENAQANPTLKLLQKLAQAFEVELSIDLGSEPHRDAPAFKVQLETLIIPDRTAIRRRGDWQVEVPHGWHRSERSARRWLPHLGEVKPVPNKADCDDQDYLAA